MSRVTESQELLTVYMCELYQYGPMAEFLEGNLVRLGSYFGHRRADILYPREGAWKREEGWLISGRAKANNPVPALDSETQKPVAVLGPWQLAPCKGQ